MSYSVSQNQIPGDLKTFFAIDVSLNNALTHGKLEVSNSTKRHADINSGNHADGCELLKICQSTIWRLQFLLITQHEAPFINKSEVTKRSRDQKENSKWTNVTNCRSRVGCQPHFTRIFQQKNKANFLVPIDFCNSSRFSCKVFLFLRRPWHLLQMYSDVACTAWNFKFASTMFTTSTIVFFLLWTKNRSQSFSISLKQSILLKMDSDLQISSKQ